MKIGILRRLLIGCAAVVLAASCRQERELTTRERQLIINRRVIKAASRVAAPGTPAFVPALRAAAARELKVQPPASGRFDHDPRFVKNLGGSVRVNDHFVIWDGSPDDDDHFRETVAVLNAAKNVICSGVVLASNRVITMQHCVGAAHVLTAKKVMGGTPIEVTASAPFFVGGNSSLGVMMLFPKNPKETITGLTRAFASPAQINACQSIIAVGYGKTEALRKGTRVFTDITVVSSSCSGTVNGTADAVAYACVPSFEMVASDAAANHDHDTCHGDSGGPALIDQGNDTYLLAALIRQEVKGKDCGGGSTFVRLDDKATQDWIATVKP